MIRPATKEYVLQATLTSATADTPAKRILFAVQLMAETGDLLRFHQVYTALVLDFAQAAPSACLMLDRINRALVDINLPSALDAANALVSYETQLMRDVIAGDITQQSDGADNAIETRPVKYMRPSKPQGKCH